MRLLFFTCLCFTSFVWNQDPQRPESRPTSRPLPPIEEPYRTEVERRDLLQQFSSSSPLEGFYSLRLIQRGGRTLAAATGYAYFGRRHFSLHTAVIGSPRATPYVQSSVRQYRIEGDKLVTSTLSGHEYHGSLSVEQPGRIEVRRFQQAGTVLRIFQDAQSYMEFVRIE